MDSHSELPTARAMPSRHQLAQTWTGAGLDLVYPPQCAACAAEMDTSSLGRLCPACKFAFTDDRRACGRCGATLAADRPTDHCPHCRHQTLSFEAALRLGPYEGALRSAVLRIKRPSERALALALGDLLSATILRCWSSIEAEAIVPVPMHWSRRWWRGTNSAESLAERLSSHLGIPLAGHLLVRRRRTIPQASLSPNGRLANVRGAFRVRKHADLPGARLLLVDDIMTTGATLNEAARMLHQGGASFVAVAVLARAEGLS